ncbi:hypothetical protein B9Z55_021560 [Caenorhabditis nigoni]|uniref:DUF38 domain-containing protein n=1 Tax=Caenorhabditis nigoni TaxID=1611254 RepID=A0A2G5TSJ9_9PELO|nr:hypothetical protein B9Z55_021560 [Caenorhabditis nigoni]
MISIQYKHRSIYLWVSDSSSVSYNQEGPDTRIQAFQKEDVLIQDNDFVTVFLEDLHQILLDQKKIMKSFQIHYEIPRGVNEENYYKDNLEHIGFRIFRQILSTLPQRAKKLKTEEFSIFNHNSEYLPRILSFLDLNSLEQVPMEKMKNFNFGEFEKILDLDIWKIRRNPENQLRLVFGFSEISGNIMEKIAFSNCSYFESILIESKIIDQLSLIKIFGNAKPETDQFEKGHRMEIPNSNGDFLIYSREYDIHYFSRFQEVSESESSSLEEDFKELSIRENLESLNLIRNLPKHLISLCLVPSDRNVPLKIFENLIILERILKNQQLIEINCSKVFFFQFFSSILEKVSSGIRQNISAIKPDPKIKSIWIYLSDPKNIQISISTQDGAGKSLNYKSTGPNTCMVKTLNPTYIKSINQNSRYRFFEDLKKMLRFQKSEIEYLRLDFSNSAFFPSPIVFEIDDSEVPIDYDLVEKSNFEFLEKLQNVLKMGPFKIKELSFKCVQEEDLMKVLEFLKPGFLKKIDIDYFCDFRNEQVSRNGILTVPYPERRSYQRTLELGNVSKMDQWKLAENLEIEHYRILTPIQNLNIAHFKTGKIIVECMSSGDVRLSLRKVCHQLRDLLDQMDFDFGIDQIRISRKLHETDLGISTVSENLLISYQWKPCALEPRIILDGIRKFEISESKNLSKIDVHNRDYDSLFFRDLGIILKFVKNVNVLRIQTIPDHPLTGFYSCPINTFCFYNNFERFLKSENIYLKIENLNFAAHSQHQVLQILPFIHSNFLETLDIYLEYPRHPEDLEAIQSIKIDKITELDQWKNAENLRIQGLIFPPRIADFEHFTLVEISIATVVEDELREIKETFFKENSRLNYFKIQYIHMDITTLLRVFGFPENRPEDSEDSENWYFQIKGDQILLKVGHYPLKNANHALLDPIYSSIVFLKCFKESE